MICFSSLSVFPSWVRVFKSARDRVFRRIKNPGHRHSCCEEEDKAQSHLFSVKWLASITPWHGQGWGSDQDGIILSSPFSGEHSNTRGPRPLYNASSATAQGRGGDQNGMVLVSLLFLASGRGAALENPGAADFI